MLALLHAAASQEARLLQLSDIDHSRSAVRLGERPAPVPMDPPPGRRYCDASIIEPL
jgi:hypothetical protein